MWGFCGRGTRRRDAAAPRVVPNIAALLLGFSLSGTHAVADDSVNWPQFRGANASGTSEVPAPITWNLESGENIRWQTSIPGLGHACPIIWQDHVYIATAVKPGSKPDLKVGLYGDIDSYQETEAHQWRLLCLNKATGKVLWEQTTNSGITAAPVSYEVDGTQYIAVQSGWGVDAQRIQDGLAALNVGIESNVPQGGVVWVFAVKK